MDFFKEVAAKLFNKPSNEVTEEERKEAKIIFYANIYSHKNKGEKNERKC